MIKALIFKIKRVNLCRSNLSFTFIFLLILASQVRAQNTRDSTEVATETVDVVKSYTPSINLRPKSKWDLSQDKVLESRQEFNYSHDDLDFIPSDLPPILRALGPAKEIAPRLLPNYFRLWLGTRSSAGVEGFVRHEINRESYLNLAFDHQQLNGAIKGVTLPTDWAESGLRAQWRTSLQNRPSSLALSAHRSAVQWYGIPGTLLLDQTETNDFRQTYQSADLRHRLGANGGWFTGLDSELSYFSDRYGVSEWRFSSSPRAELNWDKRILSFSGNISFLNASYSFEDTTITNQDYNALNTDIGIRTEFDFGDLMLNLGARAWVHNATSSNSAHLFPEIELNYPLWGRSLEAHLSFTGQYKQNETRSLADIQAFLAPGVTLQPQIDKQILRAGINGKITDLWQYNFDAQFRNFENQAYFVQRPWSGEQGSFAYDNGNSFIVNYDSGNEIKLTAKINGRISEQWDISLDAAMIDNRPDNNAEPWNIPGFSFGGSGTFHVNKQLLLTAQLLGYGSRKEQLMIADQISSENVKGFIDTQFHLNYVLTKNFSATISGINLLNQTNGLWANYPVQGVRVNLGLQYNFDAF